MTQKEIEEGIEELDKRVERLRALYDQYFLGIERLEPAILRKDVERRFWGLRREKIRNTAVRFRFQMLCQRFTTYQTFWQRVARQIEEGTYRRDVMKVRQRLELQRHERKQERLRKMGMLPDQEEEEGIDVDIDLNDEPDDGDAAWAAAALAEHDADDDDMPAEQTRPRISVHELASEVRELHKAIEASEDPSEPSMLTFGAVKRPPPEDVEDADAPKAKRASRPAAALGRVALRKLVQTPAPPVREESVIGMPRDAVEERVTPPRAAPTAAALPPPDWEGPDAFTPPEPTRPVAPARPTTKPTGRAPLSAPAPARAAAPPPSPPPAEPSAPRGATGGTGETDLRSLFLKRPRPTTGPGPAYSGGGRAPAPPPEPPSVSRSSPSSDLSEDRVRAIYDQYRAVRRQNNEGDVAFESVKKSIKEMLPKLRQKAPGRELDFEVVVKDGKTVLKPVAK
jgi:hypothetical protein